MRSTYLLAVGSALLLAFPAFSQTKLRVEGNASVLGHLMLSSGMDNILIASNPPTSLTTGSDNIFMGKSVGMSTTEGSGNIALGVEALHDNTLGSGSIAIGRRALFQNTDRDGNIAIGENALATNGSADVTLTYHATKNVAIGSSAMQANTSGFENAVIGTQALVSNTTGYENTVIGYRTMFANTTGAKNAAHGYRAMQNNTTGEENTANGFQAMSGNTEGSQNTANGYRALLSNTTGTKNVATGYRALFGNETGTNNTAIGGDAFRTGAAFTNATAVGFEAEPGASNTIRLGNDQITTIEGQVNFSANSDGRFKTKVKENVPGIEFIQALRPVTYQFDVEAIAQWRAQSLGLPLSESSRGTSNLGAITFSGFIAQEVEAAAKNLDYDFSGVVAPESNTRMYALRYAEFVVPLVKATQEQEEEIGSLRLAVKGLLAKIERQQSENESLQQRVNHLEALVQQWIEAQSPEQEPINLNQSPSLGQNHPNPSQDITRIPYTLPTGSLVKPGRAQLVITSVDGKEIQCIALSQKGNASIEVKTHHLPAGTYNYSLLVDGQVMDTKRMVIMQ